MGMVGAGLRRKGMVILVGAGALGAIALPPLLAPSAASLIKIGRAHV